MFKVKKIFNYCILTFVMLGLLAMALFLPRQNQNLAFAEPPTYQGIENSYPEYFVVSNEENGQITTAGNVGEDIFLMQGGASGSHFVSGVGFDLITSSEDPSKQNFAYIPENAVDGEYYYFTFQNNLSLYYNLTSSQIQSGQTGENLMQGQNINNYAVANGDNAFAITSLGITPQRLSVEFYLDTVSGYDRPQFPAENQVILNREGIYTLVADVNYFHTTNSGVTYIQEVETVYYTFMVFNSETYFSTVTGLPFLTPSTNIQTSSLTNTDTMSRYYFYNYSYAGDANMNNQDDLASISYNPNLYQITVDFVDNNNNTHTSTIVYENGNVSQVDENQNVINEEDYFVFTRLDSENDNLSLVFLDLGWYDISIQYLYKTQVDGQDTTYELPFDSLENTTLQNKGQRLYVYGYQAVYSSYDNIDPVTNQPLGEELKTIDLENLKVENSADITSEVNNYLASNKRAYINSLGEEVDSTIQAILQGDDMRDEVNTSKPLSYIRGKNITAPGAFDNFHLETMIINYINYGGQNNGRVVPVSTNQTPIKFLTNATPRVSDSFIYKINDNGNSYSFAYLDDPTDTTAKESFQGFNQNEAGLYVYVIQYQYDNYLSDSGAVQNNYYHYQIFFFEVTNSTPTVTVLNDDLDEIYSSGYTNQGVYIINDSQSNIFDANVTIRLSAYDYENSRYFFERADITNLGSYNMSYRYFEPIVHQDGVYTDEETAYNSKVGGHWGIYIDPTSPYANARYTIEIISANSDTPSTRYFTIDNNEIDGISARAVSFSSNTTYRIGSTISSYNTNQPTIFSWNEKDSGAVTYGYLKYIPISEINYYTSQTNSSNLSQLLATWINTYSVLPVSYKIDLSSSSSWVEYRNSKNFNSTIDASYVRSNAGFYILEVYDEAGNSSFEIFLIDDTSPLFVLRVQFNTITLSIMQNNMSILVPEDNTRMWVEWASKKAIYLENISAFANITPYELTENLSDANEKLQEKLSSFFNWQENSDILNVQDIGISTVSSTSEGQIATGIASYNGSYLTIDIDSTVYVRLPDGDYTSYQDTTNYQIDFIDETTNEAIEGTYRILLRDESNTITTTNVEYDFLNNPSAFITFNVTSDESRLSVTRSDGESLTFAGFDQTGNLYSYEYDGQRVYTHLPSVTIDDVEQEMTETSLAYKFAYYTPTNADLALTVSFIPLSENGSTLDSIILRYYPYEKVPYGVDNDSDGENDVVYYYYDVSQTYQEMYIYRYSQNVVYEAGEVVPFELALGSGSLPLAGRYELIRQYVEGNDTSEYDYFRRTITFDVDDFELISPPETVTNGNGQSSLESIVGGDIILSLYSGEGNSSIEVSFPTYRQDTGLNDGSFYTQEEFTNESTNPTFRVNGNKLPMTLYIPKYKYTTYATYDEESNSYSVGYNNNLSYYGNTSYRLESDGFYYVYSQDVRIAGPFTSQNDAIAYINENASITEYEIYVKVVADIVENGRNVTRYYYSNGTTEGGYLALYEGNSDGIIADGTEATRFFSSQGSYVVTIYQSSNDPQNPVYSFYKFGFEIISQEPDFDILTSDGYILNEISDNTYYTNSSSLTIQWEVPTSEFEAKINEDFDFITINSTQSVTHSDEITVDGNTRSFTIDCQNLILNNGTLTISMEYEGYNSAYYRRATKTIHFDRSAPTANLISLMTNTENATELFTVNYQLLNMRTYQNYLGQDVTITASNIDEASQMSYTYSLNSGNFRYYSYVVTTDYFNTTLVDTLRNSSTYETKYVYYREIPSLDSYTQVDKDSFSSGSYSLLTIDEPQDIQCGYYEIVERDYAGNMCVYIVYVIDSTYEDDENVSDIALEYENSRGEYSVRSSDITEGYNIYSKSGFSLRSLSYMSDPWSVLYIGLAGQSSVRYMASPWLEDGYVYRISVSANGINFTQVSLANIFNNVESSTRKHTLVFTNRVDGHAYNTYLSIMDANLTTTKVEDPNRTSAILNISVPTLSQYQSTTTAYVFPVNIKIYMYDDGENDYTLIMDASQINYGTWTPSETFEDASYITFRTINNGTTLQITINLGINASQKIRYEILDNFDYTTTVIQLANEVAYEEVTSSGQVYTFSESDDTQTFLAESDLTFSYNTLIYSVAIFNRDGDDITLSFDREDRGNNIYSYTFTPSAQEIWDDYYRIDISDSETGQYLRTVHFRLYSQLPHLVYATNEISNGGIVFIDNNLQPLTRLDYAESTLSVNFNGTPYVASGYTATTYSQTIRIRFKDGQQLNSEGLYRYDDGYGYSVYLSADGGNTWTSINSDTSASSGYTISGTGEYLILVKYDSNEVFTDLCRIFQINILDSSASYYYITVDGSPIEPGDMVYVDSSGKEYHTNYIVSVDYADKNNRLQIVANEELGVELSSPTVTSTGTNVYIETYHYECTQSRGDFAIIYIAETDNIISEFTYESNTGDAVPIRSESSVVVVDGENMLYDRLKLNFTTYYGIDQNLINVQVLKYFNGSYVEIYPTVYRNGTTSYIYLEKAGSYRVMLYDSCSPANVQTFSGNDYFDIVFLNTVPFIVTYTDTVSGEQIISERVDNAVYNGEVTLSLYSLNSYYQGGGYPSISVTRNGFNYTGFTSSNYTYRFSSPGHYSVTFTATSATGEAIRKITYNFTIINENESRNSFSYSQYKGYYIESVLKDGQDITQDLIEIGNFSTVRIDGITYLADISLNYLDRKTGPGHYQITINTNDPAYAGSSSESFTFELWINTQVPPISISLAEGESTTGTITITFNVQNFYNAMGDCYIRIGSAYYYFTADRIANYGETYTITIEDTGTYFIQVYNMSNNLLYSYKVIRSEPLNTFAIIAIIFGCVAAVAIIVITVLIRRKQRVK